jgi:acetyl esterase/lipase
LAHERGEIQLAFQLLAYPMLDDRTATRSNIAEGNFRLWNNASNRLGWESYTGLAPGSLEVTGLAAPSRYSDLSGLPPTWIGVGTLDLFYDENLAYESRLREAGVKCELDVVEGAFHGFDIIRPKSGVSRAFRFLQMSALSAALT